MKKRKFPLWAHWAICFGLATYIASLGIRLGALAWWAAVVACAAVLAIIEVIYERTE